MSFGGFVSRCDSKSLSRQAFRIGGTVADLETEAGLLSFLSTKMRSMRCRGSRDDGYMYAGRDRRGRPVISDSARLFGRVLLGNNVRVDDHVVIVGPAILGDNVEVKQAAVIRSSVIHGCLG